MRGHLVFLKLLVVVVSLLIATHQVSATPKTNRCAKTNLHGKLKSYCKLLNDTRIRHAIQSSTYFDPAQYPGAILIKIKELEKDKTSAWNSFRNSAPFDFIELQTVFYQKVALSLYVEVHKLVPWSILDYSDSDLEILLGDQYLRNHFLPESYAMFNNNPVEALNYARKMRAQYARKPLNSAKDLLDMLVFKMREDRWGHISNQVSYDTLCQLADGFFDFTCLRDIKLGTSSVSPAFIYSVLQAQNVPSYHTIFIGHGGIIFPSLRLAMDGDVIYSSLEAGLVLRPNRLPIDFSYVDLALFQRWQALPACQASWEFNRLLVINYLELYRDAEWNSDLVASYCYAPYRGFNPGDYLYNFLLNDTRPFYCQSEDPSLGSYYPKTVEDQEFLEYSGRIAAVANCSSPI